MFIKDIMESNVATLHRDATYEDAVRLFHTRDITGCPVLDDEGTVVGILSYKDLLRILFPFYDSYYKAPEMYTDYHDRECKAAEIRLHKVSSFMTPMVHTTTPDVPLLHAAGFMLAHHIQRLPVIENGKLVGIVTRKRIIRELFKKNFPSQVE